MKKYFLDTNFLYALLLPDDLLHARALDYYEEIFNAELTTSVLVLAELLASGSDIDFILEIEKLEINVLDVDHFTIVSLKEIIDPQDRRQVKAIDSIILTQALMSNSKLLTFDDKLNKKFERLHKFF